MSHLLLTALDSSFEHRREIVHFSLRKAITITIFHNPQRATYVIEVDQTPILILMVALVQVCHEQVVHYRDPDSSLQDTRTARMNRHTSHQCKKKGNPARRGKQALEKPNESEPSLSTFEQSCYLVSFAQGSRMAPETRISAKPSLCLVLTPDRSCSGSTNKYLTSVSPPDLD